MARYTLIKDILYNETYMAVNHTKGVVSVLGEGECQDNSNGDIYDVYLCSFSIDCGPVFTVPKEDIIPIEDIKEDRSPIDMSGPKYPSPWEVLQAEKAYYIY